METKTPVADVWWSEARRYLQLKGEASDPKERQRLTDLANQAEAAAVAIQRLEIKISVLEIK